MGQCTHTHLIIHELQREGGLAHSSTAHHDHLMEGQWWGPFTLIGSHDLVNWWAGNKAGSGSTGQVSGSKKHFNPRKYLYVDPLRSLPRSWTN